MALAERQSQRVCGLRRFAASEPLIPYTVSKLAIASISPLGTALLLALAGLLLLRARRRTGLALIVSGLAWLWLWSTPAVGEGLLHHLESRYPPQQVDSLPRADAIVVLGGAAAPPSRGMPYPDLGAAADRIWHAARVFRAGKAPLILASGGSDPRLALVPEAQVIAQLLQELGVPASAILQERESRTTQQNAQLSARVLQARKIHTILLVTSALHMPRAMVEFQRLGFEVIPAAADHSAPRFAGLLRWLPDTGTLDASARCFKELVGEWVARLR
jgi:uncharacterized SAM-binding protein YcdF (DUF218 family)